MKRGRPEIGRIVQAKILDILSSSSTPLTTIALTKICSEQLKKRISWNTTQKYLEKLIKSNKVRSITLPHSKDKNKDGIRVYILIK